jgi:RNA-directed DNA polymerase
MRASSTLACGEKLPVGLRLTHAEDKLATTFYSLRLPSDVGHLLEVKYGDLLYWLYSLPPTQRYATFQIKKRSRSARLIEAPTTSIKILQQKLNQVLQTVYRPKRFVHGFVEGRSVRTNALCHVQRRYVFNVDIKDFFHSINFGRVRGMFMAKPYNLPPKVATVLAQLCCFNGRLPQGAPTSPTVSNMICVKIDSQLQRLSASHRCTYTRYADDMTFSTSRRFFPTALASVNNLNQVEPGADLFEIVSVNGFSLHPNKVWLRRRDRRQEVTGVTVNEFPNVTRRFTNQIWAMLHAWETYGIDAAQSDFEKIHDHKHRAPWSGRPSFKRVVKGKIEYLGMIKGKESSTYLRFLDQPGSLAPEMVGERGTPRELLLRRYDALVVSQDPHGRGYLLQDLLRETFEIFAVPVEGSFTRNEGGEQIDGAFRIGSFHYIVECRWREKVANGRQVDGLFAQVMRSGDQTMGVFLSINGWSKNVPALLKQNPKKVIILMDGNDLRAVLSGKITIQKLIEEKVKELNLKAEPYLGVEVILSREGS